MRNTSKKHFFSDFVLFCLAGGRRSNVEFVLTHQNLSWPDVKFSRSGSSSDRFASKFWHTGHYFSSEGALALLEFPLTGALALLEILQNSLTTFLSLSFIPVLTGSAPWQGRQGFIQCKKWFVRCQEQADCTL